MDASLHRPSRKRYWYFSVICWKRNSISDLLRLRTVHNNRLKGLSSSTPKDPSCVHHYRQKAQKLQYASKCRNIIGEVMPPLSAKTVETFNSLPPLVHNKVLEKGSCGYPDFLLRHTGHPGKANSHRFITIQQEYIRYNQKTIFNKLSFLIQIQTARRPISVPYVRWNFSYECAFHDSYFGRNHTNRIWDTGNQREVKKDELIREGYVLLSCARQRFDWSIKPKQWSNQRSRCLPDSRHKHPVRSSGALTKFCFLS